VSARRLEKILNEDLCIFTHHQILQGDKMKECEIHGVRSMHEADKKFLQNVSREILREESWTHRGGHQNKLKMNIV
jgi:hypothetical protein